METDAQFWDRVKRYRNPNKYDEDLVRLVELVRKKNKEINVLQQITKEIQP